MIHTMLKLFLGKASDEESMAAARNRRELRSSSKSDEFMDPIGNHNHASHAFAALKMVASGHAKNGLDNEELDEECVAIRTRVSPPLSRSGSEDSRSAAEAKSHGENGLRMYGTRHQSRNPENYSPNAVQVEKALFIDEKGYTEMVEERGTLLLIHKQEALMYFIVKGGKKTEWEVEKLEYYHDQTDEKAPIILKLSVNSPKVSAIFVWVTGKNSEWRGLKNSKLKQQAMSRAEKQLIDSVAPSRAANGKRRSSTDATPKMNLENVFSEDEIQAKQADSDDDGNDFEEEDNIPFERRPRLDFAQEKTRRTSRKREASSERKRKETVGSRKQQASNQTMHKYACVDLTRDKEEESPNPLTNISLMTIPDMRRFSALEDNSLVAHHALLYREKASEPSGGKSRHFGVPKFSPEGLEETTRKSSAAAAKSVTAALINDEESESDPDRWNDDEYDFLDHPPGKKLVAPTGEKNVREPTGVRSSLRKSPRLPRSSDAKKDEVVDLDGVEDEVEVVKPLSPPPLPKRPRRAEMEEESKVLLTFPWKAIDAVSITVGDVQKLARDSFINDSLIDFSLKYQMTRLSQIDFEKIHVFTSLLYSRLLFALEKPPRKLRGLDRALTTDEVWLYAYYQVHRWTIDIPLLEKHCIIFPINSGYHWSLALCCFMKDSQSSPAPEGVILTFDSMRRSSHNPETISDVIRRYLDHEYHFRNSEEFSKSSLARKKKLNAAVAVKTSQSADDDDDFVPEIVDAPKDKAAEEDEIVKLIQRAKEMQRVFTKERFPLHRVVVSEQMDGVNCGLHLLNNAESFLEMFLNIYPDSFEEKTIFLETVDQMFMNKRFSTENANEKREELRKILYEQIEASKDALSDSVVYGSQDETTAPSTTGGDEPIPNPKPHQAEVGMSALELGEIPTGPVIIPLGEAMLRAGANDHGVA